MRMLSALAACFCVLSSAIADESPILLKEGNGRHWYRGNMHTHSLWSDGDDYPEMIARWYKEKGYDFLVFTDHNVMLRGERWIDIEKNKGGRDAFEKLKSSFPEGWTETRNVSGRDEVRLKTFDEVFDLLAEPQKYLLIQGEEITDRYRNAPVHMCATNTSVLLPPLHGDSIVEVMQLNINAAMSHRERTGQKTLVHLNHPNFGWAITAEQLMRVVGENFFEVYNGHPSVRNSGDATHASTERMWDVINTWRLSKLDLPIMYGLSTDDGHEYHQNTPGKGSQPGRGWVVVLAETLDPDDLVKSLEAGDFYSSSGVELSSISVENGQMEVKVKPVEGVTYTIDFIGTRSGFDDSTRPAEGTGTAGGLTKVYSDEVGQVLSSSHGTSASYRFRGDELYVRAVITSSQKHPNPAESGEFERAWVQPVRVAK